MTIKRRIITCVLLILLVVIGGYTYPNTEMYSTDFWLWIVLLTGGLIFVANITGENQWDLFQQITLENFRNAPIFAILSWPFIISFIAYAVSIIKESLLV